jgi:hypothetical protein
VANKDFIVKNSLVVGSTVTINGIELDLAGITPGQVLTYDGNKISATDIVDSLPSVISSYSQTIGDGSATEYTITHDLGTRDIVVFGYVLGTEQNNDATPIYVYVKQNIKFRWEATSISEAKIIFETPPTSNSVDILILSAGEEIYFSEIIGDGSSSSIELNHNLGSRDVIVCVRNNSFPYEVVEVAVQSYSTQKVILDFSKAPSNDSLVATVFLPLSGYYFGQMAGDGSAQNIYINHKLNTSDIGVVTRDTTGLFDITETIYSIIDDNNIIIHFTSPPGAFDRFVTVFAGLGGKKDQVSFDDISVDVPQSPSSPGKYGDMAWDENHIYICIATDTWKRMPLSSWN